MTEDSILNEAQMQNLLGLLKQGLDNGAFVLSEMLDKPIEIKTPNIQIIKTTELPNMIGIKEDTVTAVYLRFQKGHTVESLIDAEGISGSILIIFAMDKAFEIASLLVGGIDGATLDPKDMFESALGEVGNITGSAVLNTISDRLKVPINPSPPAVVTDMIASLLSSLAAQVSAEQIHVVLVDTCFVNESREIKGHMIVLPDNILNIVKMIDNPGA